MAASAFPYNREHLYLLGLIISIALSFGVFFLLGKRNRIPISTMWLSLCLSLPLGVVGAKLVYVAARAPFLLPMYGWQAFFRAKLNEFAIFGAVVGVLFALLVTARLMGLPFPRLLDTFAPAGLLLIACGRFCEFFVDFGLGSYVDDPAWTFFPYAVLGEYGEWFQAVFMLEGILAFLAFAVVITLRTSLPKGLLSLVLWALPQIFSESFRNESLRWGFVRVQQILCALLVLALLVYGDVQRKKTGRSPKRMPRPFALFFLGVAVCVGVEFALDKTNIPRPILYGVMIVALVGMGTAVISQIKSAFPADGKRAISERILEAGR